MKNKLIAIFIFTLISQNSLAVTIDLFSGNGAVGGTDSQITFLQGPANNSFANVFTATDFAAARNGSAAQIINRNAAWVAPGLDSIGGSASAQWISDKSTGSNEGSSVLYAIDFNVSFAAISTGNLNFYWSVDNLLGDGAGPNTGIYLNEAAVANINGGTFSSRFSSLNNDIASLLVSGTNTLYINTSDFGGPAGLLFSASIDVTEDTSINNSVPAPAPVMLMSLALLAVFCPRKSKLK